MSSSPPRGAVCAALAWLVWAGGAAAAPLLVPQRPDSVSIESAPAPLIVPGRVAPVDTTRPTPERFAREQLVLGHILERQGNLPGALMAYRNAANADPALRGPSYAAGMLEVKLGAMDRAVDSFRDELRRDPKHVDAARELGSALSAQGKHVEATEQLHRLTVRVPNDDRGWYAYGVALASAGRTKQAEAPLRKAIALAPARAIEHRDLGVVLAQLGRPAEARAEYRRALAVDSSDPSIWIDLGNLEARAGRADSALVAYREAERRDSSYALAYEAQIKTLERLNRRDEVADVYLRWVTAMPDDIDLRLRAVRELANLDRRDRALEIARDGVRHRDQSPSAHMILGLALESYGDSREALAEMRRAEALYQTPQDVARVHALIASMRRSAPDSVRALFEADSIAHAEAPR